MLHYSGANLSKVIINFKLFNPALLVFVCSALPACPARPDMAERGVYGYASVIVLLSAVSHYPNSHKRAPPFTGSSGKWSPEANCTLRRLRERETVSVRMCVCVWSRVRKTQQEKERHREGEGAKEHVWKRERGEREHSNQHSHWYPVFTLTVKTLFGCSDMTLCSICTVPCVSPAYEWLLCEV